MNYTKISGFSDEISADISKQFEVLNKLGIKYFEPRGINGKNISLLSEEEVIKLKDKMLSSSVKASSIGSPIGKIKISDDFTEHFELFKNLVNISNFLDCSYMRIFSFYRDNEEWTKEERMEVFRRLSLMIEYAKGKNIILLHENEKDIYGDNIERCLDLYENLYCDNFKAVFDSANFVQCGVDTKEAYDKLKPYIGYMHIKDALKENGRVLPAGKGDGNLPYILNDLLKSGYDGFLSLEPHLGTFEGLSDLELDDSMMTLPKSGEGTFTVAYMALMRILENI